MRRGGAEAGSTGLGPAEVEAILDVSHEAFVAMAEDGTVALWNPAAERTFGWTHDEAVGSVLAELVIPERFRDAHHEGLRRFLETGKGPLLDRRIEVTALHRDGRELPVELTISALRQDGRCTFFAFLRDISERRRGMELQARLAAVVQASADAIVSRTPDGRVTSWNRAAERLFGYEEREMLGRTLDVLVPPDRSGEAQALVERVLSGESVRDFETECLRKDGRRVQVALTVSPVHDEAGGVAELALIARDVGARRRAEHALRRANEELRTLSELKSHFVAVASHELRTPLASISGFTATLLGRWDELPEEAKLRSLGAVDREAARLRRLVDELLTISRIEAGRLAVRAEPVDVGDAVRAVLDGRVADPDVRVRAPERVVARADRGHVHQIVLNLVANAETYGRPPVVIDVARREGSVLLRVSDAGDGVPPEFVPHLFDRFTRAPEVHDTKEGTGLGLAVVKGLAEAASGEVWYEPNEPRGAAFCVRLPAADA